jgi:hypothetical protein
MNNNKNRFLRDQNELIVNYSYINQQQIIDDLEKDNYI